MAVTSSETIHRSWGGQRDAEGGASYSVTEHIVTDDPKDGPGNVMTYYQMANRDLGSSYFIGNDRQVEATLTNLTAKQLDPLNWHVVAQYKVTKGKENEDGEPESDPRAWIDEIDVSTATHQQPVRNALYMGQWAAGLPLDRGAKFMPGCLLWPGAPDHSNKHWKKQAQPIFNSAGTIYDPPIMRDVSTTIIRITRTAEEFDAKAALKYVNTLNKDTININRLGLKLKIAPETAKMISITGQRKMHEKILYWEWSIEFHVDREGWHVDILDRGVAHAKNIDPANTHDPINPETSGTAGLPGSPARHPSPAPQNVLMDDNGHPIRDPVLLDGSGGVNGEGVPAIYLRYGIYKSLNWAALDLDKDTDPFWLPAITAELETDINGDPFFN